MYPAAVEAGERRVKTTLFTRSRRGSWQGARTLALKTYRRRMLQAFLQRPNHRRCIVPIDEAVIERR